MKLADLVGHTLSHIDVDDEHHEILLTTESGRRVLIEHDQECCESVILEGVDGNPLELLGKPLLLAEHEAIDQGDPPPEAPDSWTRTKLTFRVDGATVICRWIGESNGCYSESVDIRELA